MDAGDAHHRTLVTILWALGLLALALALASSLITPALASSGYDNMHVRQAQSLLQGRLDLPEPMHDVAIYDGRYYMPFPPLPALLLLPFVALLGAQATNVVALCTGLAILTALVLRRILLRLGLSGEAVVWMLIAFFTGSVYWGVLTMSHGVWFTSQIFAVALVFLAIEEALGRRRALLVGLYLGGAFLCRQFTVALAPFLAMLLWDGAMDAPQVERWKRLGLFAAPLAVCGAGYLTFNLLRFGDPLETGYGYLTLHNYLQERFSRYGLFSLRYLPFNLYYLLFEGFHLDFLDPAGLGQLVRNPLGLSLLSSSPFVMLVVRARWKPHLLAAAWLSIVACALPILLYCSNGAVQFGGQRYTLDFFPILMLLVALGARRAPACVYRTTIAYAVVLNILSLVVLPRLGAA